MIPRAVRHITEDARDLLDPAVRKGKGTAAR